MPHENSQRRDGVTKNLPVAFARVDMQRPQRDARLEAGSANPRPTRQMDQAARMRPISAPTW
jgi:hypothetical protein